MAMLTLYKLLAFKLNFISGSKKNFKKDSGPTMTTGQNRLSLYWKVLNKDHVSYKQYLSLHGVFETC